MYSKTRISWWIIKSLVFSSIASLLATILKSALQRYSNQFIFVFVKYLIQGIVELKKRHVPYSYTHRYMAYSFDRVEILINVGLFTFVN